jgi:hypothetical protein
MVSKPDPELRPFAAKKFETDTGFSVPSVVRIVRETQNELDEIRSRERKREDDTEGGYR